MLSIAVLCALIPASAVAIQACADGPPAGSAGDVPLVERLDRPVPRFGRGPRYTLGPSGGRAAAGRAVRSLRCERGRREWFGVHLELFADGLDVVIPAGIGLAPPHAREGAYVRGGRCSYPVRTIEPTGLIEVAAGRGLTLGDFFAVWGQPLSANQAASFRARRSGRVAAYVDGERWRGDVRRIPLRRHSAIVLEVNGYFPPTRKYEFPSGL